MNLGLRDINQFVEETEPVNMNEKQLKTSEKGREEEKAFKCECCGQRFTKRSSLNTHIKIHTGEKSFKCDFCEKKFTNKQILTLHLITHTGVKAFKCDFCEKKFTLKILSLIIPMLFLRNWKLFPMRLRTKLYQW